VAQAITMVVSNGARLWLVWRFAHIQPFDRNYARLALPAAAGAVVMIVVHLALQDASWPVDLLATGLLGGAAYFSVLLLFGLAPAERGAIRRILRGDEPQAT
jgi:Polysaccharide biosynthesis C-terminal domain